MAAPDRRNKVLIYVDAETLAAFKTLSAASNFKTPAEWVRFVAMRAASTQINAERRATKARQAADQVLAAEKERRDAEEVANLMSRGFTFHAIASMTKLPYVRLRTIMGKMKEAA